MLYSLQDEFVVQGILCSVRYINNGMAWVAPIEDTDAGEGKTHYSCVTFDVLDQKGLDSSGRKAIVVNNIKSGAV